ARVGKWLARLRSADPAVRVHAALRLAALGSEAESARPALAELLRGDDPHLRKLAGWGLAQIGPRQEAARAGAHQEGWKGLAQVRAPTSRPAAKASRASSPTPRTRTAVWPRDSAMPPDEAAPAGTPTRPRQRGQSTTAPTLRLEMPRS